MALDGLAPTARHRLLFCLIAAALFVDFFDLTMGGAIAASLLHTGWTTVTLNSMFFAAAGVGAAISVFVAGLLADRIGRVRVLQICFGLMTGGTVLCMVAPTMAFLVVARVIAAMGMGGIPTIGYVYLSEILPARVRGPWISGAGIVVAASSTVASVVAYYLLPMGMWRLMFFLPVLAGVLLMLGLHFAPESPRWLDVQGHCESAAHAFARIAARPPTYPVAAAAGRATLELSAPPAQSIDLFRPPLLRRLILGTGWPSQRR